jgi:hypothetical protein
VFVQKDKVFEAVTNRSIALLPQGKDIFRPAIEGHPRWQITFMATLCPQCGWNLEGERDSVALTCSNCHTVWEASEGRFIQVGFKTVPRKGKKSFYLPFWKIAARAKGLEINSFADFMRITNQPRVVQKGWEDREMCFWIPAFKIRPRIFLSLCRQMTITQKDFEMEESIPKGNLYPITLPQGEAAQSMKLTLASSALVKQDIFPLLPRVSLTVMGSTLVYLPFDETSHELVQGDTRISINKQALRFGRYL